MNENENTTTSSEVVEVPKKRGNPNWMKKKETIMRASVTSESIQNDGWEVENKNPDFHYVWGRKSNDMEMTNFARKQYVPAKGNEKILGNPFESSKDTTGQTKERGDRILMCCPKELFDARRNERASRHVNAKDAAAADARKMQRSGAVVHAEAEETTKRESLMEQ